MNLNLNQRTIFITGGNSGIGKAITQKYAEEHNVNIAFSYHSNKKIAEDLLHNLEKKSCKSIAVPMDLADHQNIQEAIHQINEKFGGVDILVNNAVFWGNPGARSLQFEEIPIEEWQRVLDINLLGTVKVIQEVVPFMRKQKFGRIVNISSDIAYDSMPGSGPYGTMKAALSGLTSNLVTEFSADNILSNVVIPSLTFTEKALQRFPESFREAAPSGFPTKRVTSPEDVASLVVYLGSGANTHVNGEMIRATGKGSQPILNLLFRERLIPA